MRAKWGRAGLWGLAGAVLGALVWDRLAGFWVLWFVPIAWGATGGAGEAGALMAGYYGAALAGSLAALDLFYNPLAAVAGWSACTLLLTAPWALARWNRPGDRYPALRYLGALVVVSLPPLGVLGMASPWCAAAASFPGLGLAGLALALGASAVLVRFGRGLRPLGQRAPCPTRAVVSGATLLTLLLAGALIPTPAWSWPGRIEALTTQDRESASAPSPLRVLRQNARLVHRVLARIRHAAPRTTFVLPEDAAVHWSPVTALLWWPVALAAYRHHDTVMLGVTARFHGERQKRDGLLLMGRHAGLITARQPMPVTEWNPWASPGVKAHWWRSGATTALGYPAAVTICYEQLLVWPVAEAFMGHPAPAVLIGASNHWWVRVGSLDAGEGRMQARMLAAWGRLYGVPVILADNHA